MRRTSGISLMLLIFLSLCLITFSLLSVSGAIADRNLSQKSADRTAEYYAAELEAKNLLAEIDKTLADYLKEAVKVNEPSSYFYTCCTSIPELFPGVSWNTAEDPEAGGSISYYVPVNENQILTVELLVSFPMENTESMLQVACWKVVVTKEWKADTSQNVLRLNPS